MVASHPQMARLLRDFSISEKNGQIDIDNQSQQCTNTKSRDLTLLRIAMAADHPKPLPPESQETEESSKEPRVIDADAIFQGAREVWLELDGVRYRLRITRRNKLILQK
jgi:hemin uptake protein HemP